MTTPQVPPQTLQAQQQQQQLLQFLRRDLNRLSDSNRVTRLQGARAILRVYEEEASRRAAESDQAASTSARQDSKGDHNHSPCAFCGLFLSSVYAPVSALCADETSESCRATALDLVRLVVKNFLSRREVILLCMGKKEAGGKIHSWGGDCNNSSAGAAFFCGRSCVGGGNYLSSSSTGNSEAAKSLISVIAERLKEASKEVEKSEELRFINMQFLHHLLLQYAADPPVSSASRCHNKLQQQSISLTEKGWNATEFADCLLAGVAGALKDKSPSNAIEACRLLSAISQKLQVSVLLQSCKQLLERLVGCLARPQRAVRWQAIEAYDALLRAISSRATVAEDGAAAAASHIRSATTAIRPLLKQETAVENKLKMVQMLKGLVQEMSPRVLLRQKVMPHLLQLFLLLMGDTDHKVAREAEKALLSVSPRCALLSMKRQQRRECRKEQAKSQSQKLSSEEDEHTTGDTSNSEDILVEDEEEKPGTPSAPCETNIEASGPYSPERYPSAPATELAGLHLKELMADLLPRLTSWSAEERLASLRTLAALVPISGYRLLHELPLLLMQLYETCAIGEGGSSGSRQDEQQQGSPLLLLVQHAILREINSRGIEGSDCNSSNVSEPWHRGGLQELGACSSLCNSLEAVELALQCAGQVALLLPPCCWLPLVATHLGLQNEAHLYIRDKEKVLAAATDDDNNSAVEEDSERKIGTCSDVASQEEKEFLSRFAGRYQFVVDTLGLNSSKCLRSQQRGACAPAPEGGSSVVPHVCSSESRKQALLLLARLLRGLKQRNGQGKGWQDKKQHEHKGHEEAAHRGVYGLGRNEVWLLVRIIEQVQAADCGRDNEEMMPFTATVLLQLLHAAGDLCQMEAKSLFAAALLLQINHRSHPDITRETVETVCEYTGERPLKLYLGFLDDLVTSGEHGDVAEGRRASPQSLRMPLGKDLNVLWSGDDPRRLLLLRALHGAQEAADAEDSPNASNCLRMWDLVKLLHRQGTAQEAAAPVRGDVLAACLALFSLKLFKPLARPYGGWLLEHLLVPSLRWRPGEANAKLRKVALLCVSQIIPTLSTNGVSRISRLKQELDEGCETPNGEKPHQTGASVLLKPASERRDTTEEVSEDADENEVKAKPVIAALSLLSPLLVSCMDDDWNADVRSLAVGVVRQVFLDLHGDEEQHLALQQLAAATANPLQQRLDDARDDIRLAAAAALEAMLKQRPLVINRSVATEVYKSLCICLDDRNDVLATAAESALLAGADDLKPVLLEVIRVVSCAHSRLLANRALIFIKLLDKLQCTGRQWGTLALMQELQASEPSCLYPERYRRIRQKLLDIPEL